ncbi:hypothetical protein SLA2020_290710 [Shorea laevis]
MESKNLVLSLAMLLLVTVTPALASRNEVIVGRFSSVSNIRNALSSILLPVNMFLTTVLASVKNGPLPVNVVLF